MLLEDGGGFSGHFFRPNRVWDVYGGFPRRVTCLSSGCRLVCLSSSGGEPPVTGLRHDSRVSGGCSASKMSRVAEFR